MLFNLNKTPIEIINEGAFRGTYFRQILLHWGYEIVESDCF